MQVKRITIRVSPELHGQLSQLAADRSVSLNRLAEEALETIVGVSAAGEQRLPLKQLCALLAPAAQASKLSEEEVLYHAREVRRRIWREWYTKSLRVLTIELSPMAYQALQEKARQTGQVPEVISQELLEEALRGQAPLPKSAREVLDAAGRLRPLGPKLRRRITPGVMLEEVRGSLARAGGPPLSEIVLQQRGPKE
ncbi:MAG: toxin-antitoxin system HicB family antitoxin [Chloroflexi bacterium]|nr:toxin-antitoxin system HicB family antitoxin [Chloroflexota bacterium]